MQQDELLEKFEKEFEALKKKLKFKTSLEELNNEFYIKDSVLRLKYVPSSLSRMICETIIGRMRGVADYLHNLIIPNPHSMMNINESRIFDEKEKEEFKKLISQIMVLSSRNTLNGLANDIMADGKLIDDSVRFWNKQLKPKLVEVLEKINKKWSEEK